MFKWLILLLFSMVVCVKKINFKTVTLNFEHFEPPPQFCIVVICYNRPKLLKNTLNSIKKANGFKIENLFISQSWNNDEVSEIVKDYDNVYKNPDKTSNVDNRLARHFGWTFNKMFNETNCGGLVVIEDDLEVSPDFIDYFKLAIPVVERDPTLLTASLWNDIGFKHNTKDKTTIKRTSFFPGLGWYLSRHVWENIIGPEWRDHSWDWYVRDKAIQYKLDSLTPEVPRDYHVAKTGTYMSPSFFNKYFKNINVNKDETFEWKQEYFDRVSPLMSHEQRIINDIESGLVKVFWVDGFSKIRDRRVFFSKCRMLLRDTGIWEGEVERGQWNGIHHIWSQLFKSYVYIIDIADERSSFTHHLISPHTQIHKNLEVCKHYNLVI